MNIEKGEKRDIDAEIDERNKEPIEGLTWKEVRALTDEELNKRVWKLRRQLEMVEQEIGGRNLQREK